MEKADHNLHGRLRQSARTSIIDDMIESVEFLNEMKLRGKELVRAGELVDRIKRHVLSLGVRPGDPRLEAW